MALLLVRSGPHMRERALPHALHHSHFRAKAPSCRLDLNLEHSSFSAIQLGPPLLSLHPLDYMMSSRRAAIFGMSSCTQTPKKTTHSCSVVHTKPQCERPRGNGRLGACTHTHRYEADSQAWRRNHSYKRPLKPAQSIRAFKW